MDAVAAKSYSEQYEQMLREQLEQALDSIDRQEQAQINGTTLNWRVSKRRGRTRCGARMRTMPTISIRTAYRRRPPMQTDCAAQARAKLRLANYYNTYQNMLAQIHSLKDGQASDLRPGS